MELEPFVANFWWRIAEVGASLDHRALVDEARDQMREIDPAFRWGVLADFYLEFWHGRIEPARAALAEAMRFSSAAAAQDAELFRWSEHEAGIDNAHVRRAIVGRPEYTAFAAHRGDADLYFAAYEEQPVLHKFYLYYELPFSAPLLTDPRGKESLSRYGFVAYWREKGWPANCRPLGDDDFECGSAVRTE